jgi:hypothetical protein
MSKRNRPTTAAQATHRRLRHAYRSAYNSPEGKAARGAAGKPAVVAKVDAKKRAKAPSSSATKPAT